MYYNIIVDIVKLNKKYPTCNCFFIIIKRDRKIKLFFLFVFTINIFFNLYLLQHHLHGHSVG